MDYFKCRSLKFPLLNLYFIVVKKLAFISCSVEDFGNDGVEILDSVSRKLICYTVVDCV